jgi:hypothetical protein
MGTIILSALVAHTGWHWMIERWDRLRQYRFMWPEMTLPLVVTVLRWAMALVAFVVLAWFVNEWLRRRGELRAESRT